MTLDELAVAVRSGSADVLHLWERVERFVRHLARRWASASGTRCGVDTDDLVQEAYFALLAAVQTYDPMRGAFLSWLALYLRGAFGNATHDRDPLDSALSLDTPLPSSDTDGDPVTYADVLQEPQDALQGAEERLYTAQLHGALERALGVLPEPSAAVLRGRYWEGRSLGDLADEFGCTPQNVARRALDALSRLRHSSARRELERFLDERTDFYRGVGVRAFQCTGASAVERAATYRDQLEREYENGGAGC